MSIFDFKASALDGSERTLDDYVGRVMLIVNVASRCGFTPQYRGLEALYRKHKDAGLVVLGFSCNQFGAQEPGTEAEIQAFCSTNYDVSFPMFAKVEVNGANAHALYRHLKRAQPGLLGTEAIKWNFTKFLVDRRGDVVARYRPNDKPEDFEQDIVAQLG